MPAMVAMTSRPVVRCMASSRWRGVRMLMVSYVRMIEGIVQAALNRYAV